MKKRIALVAAIATAIAVGGMVPASAKPSAPGTIASDACVRAGGTLEIKDSTDVGLEIASGYLVVTGNTECDGPERNLTGLTSVTVKATSDVTFELEDGGNMADGSDKLANYKSIAFTVQAGDQLIFDASTMGNAFFGVDGTVTEETFAFGSLTGTWYAGTSVDFEGGKAGDSFDASGVTSTDVDADGNDGDDTLKGGSGDDALEGGAGYDILYGNAGNDELDSNDGASDPCPAGKNPNGNFKPCADVSGADQAWGGLGNDTIDADKGDTVAPGDGVDYVSGTAATLVYADSSAAITVNLTSKNHYVVSTAGTDYFGSAGAFVGSAFPDTFVGTNSSDTFFGGEGDDVFVTLDGKDSVYGNGGSDTITAGEDDDTVEGNAGTDAVKTGPGDDRAYGGGGDDVLYGGPGNDSLFGSKGKDQTWGGRGSDQCAGEVTDSCEFKR